MRIKIALSVSGIILLMCLQIPFQEVYSQAASQKASRQSALSAFANSNFELAYQQFSDLSAFYPKDILYKYYCGVCLVRLNRNPGKAASLLEDAIKGSMAIRSVPSDGLFYLGRAQQLSGKYAEAIKSYNSYTEQAGKKASKEAGVPAFLQQCREKKGELVVVSNQQPALEIKDTLKKSTMVTAPRIEKTVLKPADTVGKKEETVAWNYDVLMSQALDYQFRADSLSALAAEIKRGIEIANEIKKPDLRARVLNLEKLAASYQKIADQKLAEAHKNSLKSGSTAADTVKKQELTGQNISKPENLKRLVTTPESGIIRDSSRVIKEEKPVRKTIPGAEKRVQSVPEVFSIFAIEAKPVYSADEKIPVNPEVYPGLIYRIQVAVLRNPAAPAYFRGITPVVGFRNEGTAVTNYYVGMFRKSGDAAKALIRVRALGFKDAFTIAMLERKVVSADRAAILEKEWGSKPLSGTVQMTPEIQRDTIPPTLVFRIEATRTSKPLPADQMDNIKKLAGTRGIETVVNEAKQNIILIGKFLSFESASDYADLLVRNGLKEAKVVAYLGKKEIPVETAKQLFENK